jgi:zinc transporter, ZIP family
LEPVLSNAAIVGLGAIAGFTIFLGLPLGRMRNASVALRATLNALAAGILLFLLWEVLSHSAEPVEDALIAAVDHTGGWARFLGLAAVFTAGLAVGLLSLVYYDQRIASSVAKRHGPGAMSVAERPTRTVIGIADPSRRLAFLIAVGIGVHNLAEGLAIGQSAAAGELTLAVLLVIGFGLHNATEGFGIVAPMAGAEKRPSWAFLGVLGIIGGGPTFIGTLIGQSFVNDTFYLGCLALAAGSILYVVVQLLKVGFKLDRPRALYWGLLGGLLLGIATDFFLAAVGG